jgi:glycine cleavage system regulatory protein
MSEASYVVETLVEFVQRATCKNFISRVATLQDITSLTSAATLPTQSAAREAG